MSNDDHPPQRFGVPLTDRSALSVDELYGPHNDYREDPDGYVNRYETAGLQTPDSFELPIDWVTKLHPAILLEVAALAQFCHGHESTVDIGLIPDPDDDTAMLAVGRPDSDDEYVVVGAPRVGPTDGDSE
jgi:hypothetical protein